MMPLTTVVVMTPRFSPRSAGRRSPASGSPGCGGPTRPPPFERLRPHEHSFRGRELPGGGATRGRAGSGGAASASGRTAAARCCSDSRAKPSTRAGVSATPAMASATRSRRRGGANRSASSPSPARSQRVGRHRQNTETTTTRASSPMGHQKLVSCDTAARNTHDDPWCGRHTRPPGEDRRHGRFPIRRLAGSRLSSCRDSRYRLTAPRP
jgi:hypothetical protein